MEKSSVIFIDLTRSKTISVFAAMTDISDGVIDNNDNNGFSEQQLVQQRESRVKALERELAAMKHSHFELECELKVREEKIEKQGM